MDDAEIMRLGDPFAGVAPHEKASWSDMRPRVWRCSRIRPFQQLEDEERKLPPSHLELVVSEHNTPIPRLATLDNPLGELTFDRRVRAGRSRGASGDRSHNAKISRIRRFARPLQHASAAPPANVSGAMELHAPDVSSGALAERVVGRSWLRIFGRRERRIV